MVSPAIEAALSGCVASHEALQTLLLLRREAHRAWSAEDLGAALRIDRDLAASTLGGLANDGLLAVDADGATHFYRYAPAAPSQAALVDELSQAWREQPLEIIRIMNSNAIARTRSDAIRAFADAFLLPGGRRND